jgi:hypothetical protein
MNGFSPYFLKKNSGSDIQKQMSVLGIEPPTWQLTWAIWTPH